MKVESKVMVQEIVLDASVLGNWWLQEPSGAEYSDSIMTKIESNIVSVIVPFLFFDEALNILLKALSKGRLTSDGYLKYLNILKVFQDKCTICAPIVSDSFLDEKSFLAQKHSLRSYDVNYLHLALSNNILLATLDDRLIRAAKSERCYLE